MGRVQSKHKITKRGLKMSQQQKVTTENAVNQIQNRLGVVSFQIMQNEKSTKELREEYTSLCSQLSALQGVKSSGEIISEHNQEQAKAKPEAAPKSTPKK